MYSSELQRALVKQMNHSKRNDERIDWRVNEQDNTPMYQHFKGLSLYSVSSITISSMIIMMI